MLNESDEARGAAQRCASTSCHRRARRPGGKCSYCADKALYGDCLNGCTAPACSRDGYCSGCRRRDNQLPSRRNTQSGAHGASCTRVGCTRKSTPGKGGLCLTCYQSNRYGACINGCSAPAAGRHGNCSGCAKRGHAPVKTPGALLNDGLRKWCSSCKTLLPRSEYHANAAMADGIAKHCKTCTRARVRPLKQSARRNAMAWMRLHVEQTREGLCVRCENPHGEHWELDHIVPASLGGADDLTNRQVMCSACNSWKGAREAVDYRRWIVHPELVTV